VSSKRRAYLSMLRRRVLELLGRGYDVYVLAKYRSVVAELVRGIACHFAPVLSRSVVPLYSHYFAKLSKCNSQPQYYLVDYRDAPSTLDSPALFVVEELPAPSTGIAVLEFTRQSAEELKQQGYKVYYMSLE
jgi:hypothetical protein